ncbi:MAG TPA: two-component regulator propeller domain-containing protein [Chitinophagaceae bacterium]|nr:two-component regulator propeller domain-containing protein [Chitinophagaceae bacterium]HMU58540.1 two-component regulator propeller domain-containing protein [Chitinophagaceae bacterium]
MRFCGTIFSLFLAFLLQAQQLLPPIGEWREHLPYKSAVDVAAGDGIIFCATPYSLFTVDVAENSIQRYSRITGLSETGISAIHYDAANKKLVIAYSNSNIDILSGNNIKNLPDIKRDNIIGNKTVYNIFSAGKDYYLSTGLGVIVLNGAKNEVTDTWFIGNGGNQVRVNGFTSDGSYYYAATDEGLKRVPVGTSNPADYTQWQTVSGTNGLGAGICKNVLTVQNKVVAEKADSLFIQNGTTWQLFYTDGWPVVSSSVSENKILVCERQLNGNSRVVILNADGTVQRIISNTGAVSFPRKAVLYNNVPWVADQFACLSRIDASSYEQYKLNSPEGISSGEMLVHNGTFYGAAGSVNDAWNYQYNGDGVFVFKDGNWNNINRYRYAAIDSLLDYITVVVDKRDETVWAGSYGGGLLHIKQGATFEIFKQNYLSATVGDPASYRVAGLAFDGENNLWISNYGAEQPLRVRKNDGSWKIFSVPFGLTGNALSQIIIDDNNYKWIVSPKGNGLICFDHNSSIDNTGDDHWRRYTSGAGNGNLPNNNVLCVAKDKSGFIWVGTADGVGVIQCPESVFSAQACDAVWPVVSNGNFAGYLFKGQQVRSIAVDGADRKWIATKNGVFLVSADGEKVIYQFTEDNSPLLSNDVRQVTIDGKTGEVYFATLKGICSFRSTATEGAETNEEVLVFPNPVPSGYAGTIAIRGLVNNANVKITELDGRLVYQTRALGGQAVWDGRNYKGQKIASGVYLVLVSDDNKKERTAAKIFFINR